MVLLRAIVAISSTFGFVTVGCIIAWRDPSRRRIASVPVPLVPTGGVLLALGLSLRAWATWVFWSRGHGTPVPPLVPMHLVTAGPYAFTRNPLYVGTVATSAGMGLLLRSPLLLVTTLVGCFVLPVASRSLGRALAAAALRRGVSSLPRARAPMVLASVSDPIGASNRFDGAIAPSCRVTLSGGTKEKARGDHLTTPRLNVSLIRM